jgi:hypothetical protein
MSERVTRNLLEAVKTMRDACNAAERAIVKEGDAAATLAVMHAFAWGWANASGSVENAMSWLDDESKAGTP